tara:strand:- start:500 stop:832 length:333 start_codon:yes stop_codon:yes gene_type:complete
MYSLKDLKQIPPLFLIIATIVFGLWFYKKINEVKDQVIIKKSEMKSDEKSEQEIMFEKFAPPKRYMYQSSGIKRNSSWDLRGEDSLIKFEPEKTGVFNASALKNNYTNKK